MSQSGFPPFDSTVQLTNMWLRDLAERLGGGDRQDAYAALRAVLHALRDRLTIEEVADLAAQLPMLVRGFYYEGWRPHGKPRKERKSEEFLAHVSREMHDRPDIDPKHAAQAVFDVLAQHVTAGEIEDIKSSLPADIRSLWPSS
jgi:uncharacterized protein (DUF2267 family)